MRQTKEFSGKNVETAIKNACMALDSSEEELEYDIISSGASGIFGIVGRKNARIRVTLPDGHEDGAPDEDVSDRDMERIKSIVDEAFSEETRVKVKPAPKQKIEAEDSESPPAAMDVTQASVDLGVEALTRMAGLITEDAKVTAETSRDRLTLRIEGGSTGILIGKKGQTLEAMQFLTDKIINRKSDARVRVKVDIEGYMETRKTSLESLAHKMASKAKKTQKPATINQMSAQDRRIVHLALKDDSQVRTQSMGTGYYRRLVIFPKKKNAYKGKRRARR